MALDPNIPLMAVRNAVQIRTPFENAMGAAELKRAQMQNRLADFQMQEQEQMRAALQGATSPEEVQQRLYKSGSLSGIEAGAKVGKSLWDAKAAKLKYDTEMAARTRDVFSQMTADHSDEGIRTGAEALVVGGIMDADKALAFANKALSMPPQQRRQWLAAQSNHVGKIIETAFPAQTEFERTLIASGVQPGTQQWQEMMAKRAEKQATNAPGVSLSFGAPVQGVIPGSNDIGLFLPPKGPGQEAVPLSVGGQQIRAPKQPSSKSLPLPALRELSEAGATFSDFDRLSKSFDDSFGGYGVGVVGEAANVVKRNITGDPTGQAQWWQDYQNQKNLIRNKLFGAALTATEKAEFDKAQISPGMRPEQIRQNLARQHEAARKAAVKMARALKAGTYDQTQIEEALGMPIDAVEDVPETKLLGEPAAVEAEIKALPISEFEKAKILDAYKRQLSGSRKSGPQEGQKSKSKSGKSITFRNGQWEYD